MPKGYENGRAVVRVMPYVWSEEIHVLVPPKFYAHPQLAEAVKSAIEKTQASANEVLNREHEDNLE